LRLEALGLHSFFDAVLSVPDLWRQDPDHGVFEIAADGTQLPHDQLGFVGRDTAMLSLAGKAGICRIAVNYDQDAVAEVFIEGFDQLLVAVPWATSHTVVP
jgi:FMN phosphatase YigB (HAD superfamily)